jgi:spore coat protein A
LDKTRRRLLIAASRLAATLPALKSTVLRAAALDPQQQPGGMAGHAMGAAAKPASTAKAVHRPLRVDRLEPFVDAMPRPRVAKSLGLRPAPGGDKHNQGKQFEFYRMTMRPVPTRVHRDVPPTVMWSYGETVPGPTIEASAGRGVMVEWVNGLPEKHFLPIDHTLHGAGADQPEVRSAVHLHGAKAAPQYDGYPEDWQTPGQHYQAVYPLDQDAATLWYHDHAMGIERLNQYAGLYGFFLVRDEAEKKLGLPGGEYEIPIAFADRLFSEDGSLYYPDSGDDSAPWVPEVYGDAMLVNGKITPFLEVEPRAYRFRMLNASNSRTYVFSLSNRQKFHQIGSDQGLLSAPVEVNQVQLSPGERADVVIDFRDAAGQRITLNNLSWELMQFRVGSSPAPALVLPAKLRVIEPIPESAAVKTRLMILREFMEQNPRRMLMLLNATHWHEPCTEKPELDSVEIWSFANTTADIHPIHLHMVRFQVLDRRSFDADEYLLSGKLNYVGVATPPPAVDRGWKDTVQTYPETVTRIIVKFEGYTGRYVWHCHLLEHAANEMMRPFEVVRPSGQ